MWKQTESTGRTTGKAGLITLTIAALLLATTGPLEAQTVTREWAQNWQDDLRFLAWELPRTHPDPFSVVPRPEFEERLGQLIEAAPEMSHEELVVGLARVVASLGDGHTRVTLPLAEDSGFFRGHSKTPAPHVPGLLFDHLPLRLVLLADGLVVRSAAREHAAALGARVLKIGDKPVDEAIAAVSPVVHRDNQHQLEHQLPDYLVLPQVLTAVGVIDSADTVDFTVAPASGRPFVMALEPVAAGASVDWVEAFETAGAVRPLYRRNNDRKFWYEFLPRDRAVYFQYNEVADEEEETLAEFAERLFTFVEQSPVDKLIIDLRRNRGGNNGLNQAILHRLIRSAKLREPGSLFVITGGATFSAAMMFCIDLAKHTPAVFVGLPTGAAPNHFGDSRKLRLPRTGLTVRVSTLEWQYSDPRDERQAMEPHIPTPASTSDYRLGRDRALEAILRPGAPIGADSAYAGTWRCRLSPGPWTFDFAIALERSGPDWSGTISLSELGLVDARLEEVVVADGRVRFVLPDPGSGRRYVFVGRAEGQRIYGSFSYASRSVPFVLTRG